MRLLVDHISLTQGSRRSGSRVLGVSEPASFLRRHAPKTAFYSLCVLEGAGADDVTSVVTDALHAEFAKSSGRSVTSNLIRAVQAGQDALHLENARSLPQHRCTGAIVTAAVKDDSLYLAYVGGVVVYAWQGGRLRRLVGPEVGNGGEPSAEECEVGLASCRLEPGDAVIMASSGLSLTADESVLEALIERADGSNLVEALERAYVTALQPHDFSAAVLWRAPAQESPATARRGEAAGARDGRFLADVDVRRPVAPAPDAAGRCDSAESSAAAGGAFVARSTAEQPVAVEGTLPKAGPRVSAGAPAQTEWPRREVLPRSATKLADALGPSLVRVLLRFSAAAIIVAVFAVALYLGEEIWQAHGEQAKAEEMLALLERKEHDALAATDIASRRWLLTEASRVAASALAGAADERVVAVANRIMKQLDQINGVVRLAGVQLLADFAGLDRGSQPAQILGVRGDLYVLDRGVGGLWYLKLGKDPGALGPPKLLWRAGDKLGEVVAGDPMSAFWMYGAAPGLPEQIYVLDSRGQLVRCLGQTVGEPLRLPGAGALSKVRAAAGQAGNLFVLDTQRRLVWRYVPGANGYDGAAAEYLTETSAPDLAAAVDMALDGNLYVLASDGRIDKFAGGKAQPFPAVVPDTPLRNPVAIFASPATRFVYVADAGNARVVKFTKTGEYVSQYRAHEDAFADIRSVFVDEEGGRLYAIVGTRVFMAEVPAEDGP